MPTRRKNPVPAPLRPSAGRFTNLSRDKLRGGYYTSREVAAWICTWAVRANNDKVLEPSCGDGAFLRAAVLRYRDLGAAKSSIASRLTGVEIMEDQADNARESLRTLIGRGAEKVVQNSDFFSWRKAHAKEVYDAVIGNPPFIRYQTFPEPYRSLAMSMMASEGLAPNKLTNMWVPFVVAAAAALRPGGRLGFVLPAEILQVTYAAQLRSFLTDRFKRIDVVACNELFFEKAEQEVVLLLADGRLAEASDKNPCRVAMTEAQTVSEIIKRTPKAVLVAAKPKTIRHDSEKWLKYFLTEKEISLMRALRESGIATSLSSHASVDVGVVTGRNEFFVLTTEQVERFGLGGYTAPLVSRSAHLKGTTVRKADWKVMSETGGRVHLLDLKRLQGAKLPPALRRYIKFGEQQEVHTGYKCSIRKPWYEVPSVWVPDGFLFRQIYDFPRVVLNRAGATSTDTIHRLRAKQATPERVVANTYSWLTAASAEIEGRSYGGGVLELEPTEAERLLMPAALNGALPLAECDRLTRAGRLDEALEQNARIVLMGHMGLSKSECAMLRDIWFRMRDRRMARKKGGRPSGIATESL
jgi:adenine-specific DNA-methyltransferase